MRTHSIAIAITTPALLLAAAVRLSPPDAPPSIDLLRAPSPPDFWKPVSTFAIPVKSAQGAPIYVAARPLNLDSSVGADVPASMAENLWRLAEPATVRVQTVLDPNHGLLGTGVIVSPSGLALTALHVVDASFESLHVVWNDGQQRAASVVARDPEHDLALLQIAGTASERFSFLRVAGPYYVGHYDLRSGAHAVLMGFGGTPHRLRALPARLEGERLFYDLTWADHNKRREAPYAIIYEFVGDAVEGDSGSPVLDERGTVIGVTIGVSVNAAGPRDFVTELPHNFSGGLNL